MLTSRSFSARRRIRTTDRPVSYTHLDVYKRQHDILGKRQHLHLSLLHTPDTLWSSWLLAVACLLYTSIFRNVFLLVKKKLALYLERAAEVSVAHVHIDYGRHSSDGHV